MLFYLFVLLGVYVIFNIISVLLWRQFTWSLGIQISTRLGKQRALHRMMTAMNGDRTRDTQFPMLTGWNSNTFYKMKAFQLFNPTTNTNILYWEQFVRKGEIGVLMMNLLYHLFNNPSPYADIFQIETFWKKGQNYYIFFIICSQLLKVGFLMAELAVDFTVIVIIK